MERHASAICGSQEMLSRRRRACRSWRSGHAGGDGAGEGEPLGKIGLRGPGFRIAQMAAKQIHFIADLEVLQSRAEGLGDKFGFLGGAGGSVGSHVDAVEAGPAGGFKECGQVANRFRSDRVVAGLGLADNFARLRVLRLGRVGSGFPPAEFAGVAAEPQNAARGNLLECANQAGILRRKEVRIRQLPNLVGEADKIRRECAAPLLRRE